MKRELKFRCFDTLSLKMYMGNSLTIAANGSISFLDDSGNWIEPEEGRIMVMQYTGQNYGKQELYEGDIVEIEYYDWVLEKAHHGINPFNEDKSKVVITLVCEYGVDSSFHLKRIDDGSRACYAVQFSGSAVKRKEIIGNVYENPELLNRK